MDKDVIALIEELLISNTKLRQQAGDGEDLVIIAFD